MKVNYSATSIALQVIENSRTVLKNKKIEYKFINKEKEKLKEQTALMEEMFDEDINTVLHGFRLDPNKDNTLTKLIDLFKVLEKLEK